MQIGTSFFYDSNAARLAGLSARANTLNTQIATTKKISAPSQDVVAYNRLASIKRATADGSAYAGNISLAKSLLQQSDTTLGAIATQIGRAQELTVQAASGTLNEGDRKTIAIQLQSIRDDLVALAGTTDARGQPLFGSASGAAAVSQASDGSVTIGSGGEVSAIPVDDDVSVAASDSAARVFGGIATSGGGTTDVFAVLRTYIAALNAGGDTSAASGAAADGLQGAFTQVSTVQGSVGARGARLDIVVAQGTDAASAREIDRSALEDTDVTAAIADLQKTMTILQAAQASFTRLGQLSLFDYLR